MKTNWNTFGLGYCGRGALGLLFLAQVLVGQEGESRVWTNQTGRTVQAKFVELSGANVVLELENGSRSSVALATLSRPDQVYVQTVHGGPAPSGSTDGQAVTAASPAPMPSGPMVWPGPLAVNPKAVVVTQGQQDAANRKFHYQTGSFGFICNAPLAGSVMQEVAADFELTRAALVAMPWGWQPKPKEGTLFKIYLTETDADYIALGGSDSTSAGSKDDYIFLKFSAMGLKKVGPRYAFDSKQKEEGQVINMTSFLLLGEITSYVHPWANLGIGRLMRDVAYHRGVIRFNGLEPAMRALLKDEASKGVNVDLQRLITYMRTQWSQRRTDVRQIRMENNLDGLLLVYYFGFMDGDGSGAGLHAYYADAVREALDLRAYKDTSGASERPVSSLRREEETVERLNQFILKGRDDATLAAEMAAKFRGLGVKLN